MRPVRIFIIVNTILFCLAAALPVHAVDPLFTATGCSDDPTVPCATSGDGVNTFIELSKAGGNTAITLDKLLNTDIFIRWLGVLKPLDDIYHNANEKLDALGNQVQSASDNELNPAQLQDVEQHDESKKPATMTSRVCVVDPQTGQMKTEVSKTQIVSPDQPWLRAQGEGSRRLSSFTTGYTQESQDYRLPETDIKVEAALPCGSPLQGQKKQQQTVLSDGENNYGDDPRSELFGIAYKVISWIELFTPEGKSSGFRGSATGNANIVGTAQNPYAGHTDALTAGCASSSDLNDISYATDEQKQKLCAAGGFVNSMYRPDAIDATYKFALNANDPDQEWHQTVADSPPKATLSNAFAGRVEAAGDYMNCTLMPADYQNTAVPDGACNKNWVSASSTTSGNGSVCEVAKAYNIPCCQLQGVMETETGGGTSMGNESCSTNHGTFQCCHGIGCGPAGVLCGQYNAFAGNDTLDLCSPVGAAELLARAMLLKLCQADGKCNSYDWTKWGEFVKKNYKVNDGDYTATAYFYGLANGCTVSACSQYRWGPGKGYCDSVASYCTTGQILPANTSPQFCKQCNEEVIRAHQTPIQCPH